MLLPDNEVDAARWQYTRMCRNILGGTWELEILTRMKEQYGLNNVNNMGRPSMSVNLYSNTVDQVAIIYTSPGVVTNELLTDQTAAIWTDVMEGCHLWAMCQEMNRKVVGLRESFYHIVPTATGLQLQIVTPDEIVVLATTGDASTPTALKRAITIATVDDHGRAVHRDCWEIWDVSDPAAPRHVVIDGAGVDVTLQCYPEHTGEYVYTDENGPFLPWELYRGRYTGETFDPYWGSELVHGTLDIAIHWTMWGVCLRNNSWPVSWLMDADVPGMSAVDNVNGFTSSPPDSIELSPNSILRFKSEGQPGVGKVGQLQAADAKSMADAILMKQATILNNVGIHPDDLSQSGQPQSGVAIQLKRSYQRKVALGYVPMFQAADQRLYSKMARVWNIFYGAGTKLPVDGWKVEYSLPETSTDEFLADLKRDQTLIELGLKSTVDLCMKLYNLDEGAAIVKLQTVADYQILFPLSGSTASSSAPKINLTPTDIAGIVTVNEARASQGLPPMETADGLLTVAEYQAKNAAVTAAAAQAANGTLPTLTP